MNTRVFLSALGVLAACVIAGPVGHGAAATTQQSDISPTPGAENVTSFGATPNDATDDTAAFKAAIAAAATDPIYPDGPSGQPQGVVYVPAGVYRVCNVSPLSNVRIEFDAGAVMELTSQPCSPTIMGFDRGVTNVSLVGVGTSTVGKPTPQAGWDISHSFEINTDPATTGSSDQTRGISVRWVTDALIENVFTVQNDSQTSGGGTTADTSESPAITMSGLSGSTASHPELPSGVTVINDYNVGSPVSFGGVQVSACVTCSFQNLFSQGGVTLRLESDAEESYYASTGRSYYSTISALTADNLENLDGRQALTMSPHNQKNGVVTVTNVTSISSTEAVRTFAKTLPGLKLGYFSPASSVTGVTATAGTLAQRQVPGSQSWWSGPSKMAVDAVASSFTVQFSQVSCGGLKSTTACE